jgi:hypothetical protein
MPKIMLNYGPNGRRRLGRPLKRLLDEAAKGLSRSNSWPMMMMIMIMIMTILNPDSPDFSLTYGGDLCPHYDMNFDLLFGISLLLTIVYWAQEDLPDTLNFKPTFYLQEDKVYIIYTLRSNQRSYYSNTNKDTIVLWCSFITGYCATFLGHSCGHLQGGIHKNTIIITMCTSLKMAA